MNSKIELSVQHPAELAVFETQIGWFAIAHRQSVIASIKFGAPTRKDAIEKFLRGNPKLSLGKQIQVTDSQPFWLQTFVDYASGQAPSFANLELEPVSATAFQQSVLDHCRLIPYGTTLTYGELAAKAGSPKAARAVGSTMKSNRFPIVIPCHRVTGAKGLGGFSASNGVSSKRNLLTMEGAIKPSPQQTLPGI